MRNRFRYNKALPVVKAEYETSPNLIPQKPDPGIQD